MKIMKTKNCRNCINCEKCNNYRLWIQRSTYSDFCYSHHTVNLWSFLGWLYIFSWEFLSTERYANVESRRRIPSRCRTFPHSDTSGSWQMHSEKAMQSDMYHLSSDWAYVHFRIRMRASSSAKQWDWSGKNSFSRLGGVAFPTLPWKVMILFILLHRIN